MREECFVIRTKKGYVVSRDESESELLFWMQYGSAGKYGPRGPNGVLARVCS